MSAYGLAASAEETFELLLEAAPDAIVVTKGDGTIVIVNTQTEQLFGYHREELLGQRVELLVPQVVRRRHVKRRAAVGLGLEVFGRRKNGTEFPIDISLSHLETRAGMLVSRYIRDITERKRSEELVSHLAAIVQASDDAIIGKSLDGTIVSWNSGAERLYGYTAKEVIGQPLALLVPPDRADEFAQIMKGLRQNKHIERYDTVRLHREGHRIDISVTISPVKGSAGTVIGASVIARDITERKRAEELASHLASIVEASDDAIFAISLDGTVVSWNSSAERLYGFKAEEVVGRPLSPLITGGRTDRMAKIIKALRQGERIEQLEITHLHKDGYPTEISMTVSPVKDRAGVVIGASVIARDITRQKGAEEALRQSEERFRVALKSAPVTVFNHDRQLRYTWINSPAAAWGKPDYLGHTDAEIVGGKEGARLTAIKQAVLRSGLGTRVETEVILHGETHYFDTVVEPIRGVRGAVVGLTCSATDITPTKKSLVEREALIAKLQDALEEVNLLSGLLSICASCKRIANEHGTWEPLESYLQTHSQAKFSHGVCPDCLRKLYPDYYPASEREVPALSTSRTKRSAHGGSPPRAAG